MAEVARAPGRDADARAVEDRIDWRQVRLVVGAHWRIVVRAASASVGKLLLTALGLAILAGLVVGATVATYLGIAYLRSDPQTSHVAGAAVHGIFLFSLVTLTVSPALGLRGNEFLDVTKLFSYPVNHRTVFAASLAGLLTSGSVLLFTVPLFGAVLGYGGSPAEILGGLAAALMVAFTGIALGQTALLLFLDVFRSRKWRDLSRLVVALFGAGLYAGMRLTSGSAMEQGLHAGLATLDRWKDWLLPVPSWWGAHAVTGTGFVRWLPALALPVLVVWLVRVAGRLQERAYFGEIEERTEAVSGAGGGGIAGWFGRRVPGAFGAALEKDLRLLFRDPTVRLQLIQRFAFLVVPLAAAFVQGGRRGAPPPDVLLAAIVYLPALGSLRFALNPLGTEGPGIQQSVITPASRRTILGAKVAALCVALGGGISVLVALATFVAAMVVGRMDVGTSLGRAGLAILEHGAVLGVFAGIGAVVGPFFPQRAVTRERRALKQASTDQGGCVSSLVYLAAFLGGLVVCAPIAFAFHHPAILAAAAGTDSSAFLALSVPLALAYGVGLAIVGVRIGGAVLVRREETVVAELTKSME